MPESRSRHISEEMALAFFRQQLPAKDRNVVVRHLLSRCARCSSMMFRIGTQIGILAPGEVDSFAALAAAAPVVGRRRIHGLSQFAVLSSVEDSRASFINRHKDFHTLGLYERLIEVARVEMVRDPFKAYELSNLAVIVAHRLEVRDDNRNDLLATATAMTGNASRLLANFDAAEMAFAAAWQLREEGTADYLVDGLIYRYEGAYFAELGRYDEADASLNNALMEYSYAGDEHLQGRTLLSLASVAVYYDPGKAAVYLGRANMLYDPLKEPMLEWCSRNIEIWCLNEVGKPEVALELLEASRDLYNHFGRNDLWVRHRGYWIEARIAFNLRQFQVAERILTMLLELVDKEGKHPVDETLIAVDLLQAISAQEQRENDVIAFSEKLLPLLNNLGLHQQGRAVLLLLRDALLRRTVDTVGWARVKDYFRRHWWVPLPSSADLIM